MSRLTTPPGTSDVASTSASSTAGSGRSVDATTTAVQPVASTGASTSTSPVSDEAAGASTPITPVGTGVEKLTYGPATGFTDPSTVAILSVQPAYQTQRSTAASTAAPARLRLIPSAATTSSTNPSRRACSISATR